MSFSDADYDEVGAPKAAPDFQVKALLATFARFYWIVLLTMVIAAISALVYLKYARPMYRSTAEMKVESRYATPGLNLSGGGMNWNEMAASEDVATLTRSFLNVGLMDRVIKGLDLENRDNFIGPGRPAASVSAGELMGNLLANSSVSQIPGTRLLQISFMNWEPATALEVTDALVKNGIENDRDQRIHAVEASIKYLQAEALRLEEELRNSEEKRNAYIRSLGNLSIDEETDFMARQIQEVNSNYLAAKNERMAIESDFDQIEKVRDDYDKLITIQRIRDIPSVIALSTRANELRANLAKLRQRYRAENPFVLQAQSELKEVEQSLREEIIAAPKSVEFRLELARQNEKNIAAEQAKLEEKSLQVKELSIEVQVFQRQIEASRIAYEAVLKRLSEEQSQSRSQPVLLQVVAAAGPASRATLQPQRVLGAAIIGGGILGVAIIFLISQLSGTLKSAEDAESSLNRSVVGSIPRYHPEKGSSDEAADVLLPTLTAKNTATSEAFRTLRTFLQVAEESDRGRSVLLTGAGVGDGTSFCALNLAVALAQSGQRTLLVDADLRKPSLEHSLLGADGNYGLSDYLEGSGGFSSILRPSPIPYLDLVPAGSRTWHSAEILARPRFREFLEEVEPLYDRIVFDSAPINIVSDTLCFARYVSLVWVVVKVEGSTKAVAQRSIDLLTRSGASVAGLVVNCTKEKGDVEYASAAVAAPPFERGFPFTCVSCGRVYDSFSKFTEQTVPVDSQESPGLPFRRRCECGALVILPAEPRRDKSSEGQERRRIFGDLIADLLAGGISRDEARSKLLLALKILRSEDRADLRTEGSDAALRRQRVLQDLVQTLVKAGVDRDQAISRLQHAIQVWRNAP